MKKYIDIYDMLDAWVPTTLGALSLAAAAFLVIVAFSTGVGVEAGIVLCLFLVASVLIIPTCTSTSRNKSHGSIADMLIKKPPSLVAHPMKHSLMSTSDRALEQYAADVIKFFLCSKMAATENVSCISAPAVEFCSLDSKTAGQYSGGTIKLSDRLTGEDRNALKETIIHEVAHHVDTHIRGVSCHDSYWDNLYRSCGGEGNYLEEHGITTGKNKMTNNRQEIP